MSLWLFDSIRLLLTVTRVTHHCCGLAVTESLWEIAVVGRLLRWPTRDHHTLVSWPCVILSPRAWAVPHDLLLTNGHGKGEKMPILRLCCQGLWLPCGWRLSLLPSWLERIDEASCHDGKASMTRKWGWPPVNRTEVLRSYFQLPVWNQILETITWAWKQICFFHLSRKMATAHCVPWWQHMRDPEMKGCGEAVPGSLAHRSCEAVLCVVLSWYILGVICLQRRKTDKIDKLLKRNLF